jgi:hypothetical protein
MTMVETPVLLAIEMGVVFQPSLFAIYVVSTVKNEGILTC